MSKFIKHEKGFFDQILIKKLRSLPNGSDCVIIYQKILELALDTDGTLIFSEITGSIEDELSLELNENKDNVRSVIDFLINSNLLIKKDESSLIIANFEEFVNTYRKKFMNNYMKNYRKKKTEQMDVNKCNYDVNKCNYSVITKNNSVITNDKNPQLSEPAQPSDTGVIAETENVQNEQVSTNTRTCARAYIDINNNYNKDLKDINNNDLNNKDFKELNTKDLNTKKLNNKNLKPKDLKTKNIYARVRDDNSQELVIKNNNCVKKSMNKDKELLAIAKDVITHFNLVTGSKYRIKSTSPAVQLIITRLKEGYEPQDFITVIDKKTMEWKNDQQMRRYLRPNTLFSNKHFEEYLNQPVCTPKSQDKAQLVYEQFDMLDEMFKDQPGLFDDILNEPKKDYFNRFDKEACA